MKPKLNIYIAGGWFTPESEKIVVDLENACKKSGVNAYSPRKHSIYSPSNNDSHKIVMDNITNIVKSDLVVASTENKDMGTLWECGYAFGADIPVVYYFPHTYNFNIMLKETCLGVFSNLTDLMLYLRMANEVGVHQAVVPNFTGEME